MRYPSCHFTGSTRDVLIAVSWQPPFINQPHCITVSHGLTVSDVVESTKSESESKSKSSGFESKSESFASESKSESLQKDSSPSPSP